MTGFDLGEELAVTLLQEALGAEKLAPSRTWRDARGILCSENRVVARRAYSIREIEDAVSTHAGTVWLRAQLVRPPTKEERAIMAREDGSLVTRLGLWLKDRTAFLFRDVLDFLAGEGLVANEADPRVASEVHAELKKAGFRQAEERLPTGQRRRVWKAAPATNTTE